MITIIRSDKGGAGKTMTAVNLAAGLALAGQPTLLVDFDPKSDAVSSLGLKREQAIFDWLIGGKKLAECVRESGRDNLFVLPGDGETYTVIETLDSQIRRGAKPQDYLSKKLAEIPQLIDFAHIVVDMPPISSYWTLQPVRAADKVVVPTKPDMIDIGAMISTLNQVIAANPSIAPIIVPSIWHCGRSLDNACYNFLTQNFPDWIISMCVPDSTVYAQARSSGQTIWEYTKSDKLLAPYYDLMVHMGVS